MKPLPRFGCTLTLLLALPVITASADGPLVRGSFGSQSKSDIQIVSRDVLRFGDMVVRPHTGGVIVVDPAGHVTTQNGVVHLGGVAGPAVFELRGKPNARFLIDLPTAMELRADRGSGTALLHEFRSVPDGLGTFDAGGRALVRVGAALELGGGSMQGDYSTEFELRVEYEAMTKETDKKPGGFREP